MALYRIHQLALPLGFDEVELMGKAAKLLRLDRSAIRSLSIERKSVDARDKGALKLVYGLLVQVESLPRQSPAASIAVLVERPSQYELPMPGRNFPLRPVVVGTGPAGLFAALILAEAGANPLILERGERVEDRERSVHTFFGEAELDPESNIQFGEGGAGTYSDGKLTTQVKDERCRDRKVIDEFIAAGAPEEISWLSKPHLGTDRLIVMVANLRRKIESLGGEFRFRCRMDNILRSDDSGGHVTGVVVNGKERIDTDCIVLAPGHSARDTFSLLARMRLDLEPKPFAIGVRIEHPQEMISRSQFGPMWQHPSLPAADYKLTARSSDGRGVYSFCMCPGGTVVNSSSEMAGVVCNGMSNYARDGRNANSALVVSVGPEDFDYRAADHDVEGRESQPVLAGIGFQRRWERLAFAAGGGRHSLPVQTLADLKDGRKSVKFGAILPAISGRYGLADLTTCLPPFAVRGILQGLGRFGRTIEGFDRGDAVLTGVETRTSSPVRILRDENCESSLQGLYPAGEGAGYAGGIMSAAMDGIRVAEKVLSR